MMATQPYPDKVEKLRKLMKAQQLDYYYVPSTDPHNSEYVPDHWQRRAWITAFTGSAGEALIGTQKAYLWTDARYFLQAERQLNSATFTLMRQAQGTAPPIATWLQQHTNQETIGVDPRLISIHIAKQWQHALAHTHSQLMPMEKNLVDEVWENQPPLSTTHIECLEDNYTGKTTHSKLAEIRQQYAKMGCDAHVVTTLDAIAWTCNIRGNDIPYNPMVISYLLITNNEAYLYCDTTQISNESQKKLASEGIKIKAYAQFTKDLANYHGNILVDPKITSWWVQLQLKNAKFVYHDSPITLMKARKNPTEIAGMFEAHRLDALALCQFFHWLEHNWQGETELSVAERLEAFRRDNPRCRGLSFNTISGYGPNGAIVHYSVTKKSDTPIGNDNLFLIDSGGQYSEGTTDVTRTIHLGQPTAEQRRYYTLVLKGHLAFRHLQFPYGCFGEHLNAIPRLPLWKDGLDFGHGCGHGVGCYLCVHEGPQRIAYATTGVPLEPGMIVSNEPGIYFKDNYGIRIENLCLIKECVSSELDTRSETSFLGFEDLTLVPYARNLIDLSLLTKEEIEWINQYHQQIADILLKSLPHDVQLWLKNATRALS